MKLEKRKFLDEAAKRQDAAPNSALKAGHDNRKMRPVAPFFGDMSPSVARLKYKIYEIKLPEDVVMVTGSHHCGILSIRPNDQQLCAYVLTTTVTSITRIASMFGIANSVTETRKRSTTY